MTSRLLALAVAAAAMAGTVPVASAAGKTFQAYRHILLDGHRVKWGLPEAGAGAVVRYAMAEVPLRFPTARNCQAMVPIAPLLAASGVSPARFESELRAAFALWSTVADIRFVPAASPESADILIGAQASPRGRAATNVEWHGRSRHRSAAAPGDIRPLSRALICLNPQVRWKAGFDGDLAVYDLRYTLLHEIGHAIGLDHPAVASQLMDFRYQERFRAPQAGDITGVVALYGPSRTVTAAAALRASGARQVAAAAR